jgi:hypothetical protein
MIGARSRKNWRSGLLVQVVVVCCDVGNSGAFVGTIAERAARAIAAVRRGEAIAPDQFPQPVGAAAARQLAGSYRCGAYRVELRVAGDELDEAIVQYMKRAYSLMIGERTAEEIKIRIGSAYPIEKEMTMEVKGRDMVAGLPKTITITSQEVREALVEPLNTIVDAVRVTLERCPPELSADLVDRGIMLAGGGALLRGFDKLLQEETGLPVHIADDPLSAVGVGTGMVLNELAFLQRVASMEA